MAISFKRLKNFILETGPLILLFYICISEFHTQFYYWKIFSFNLQFIIIYYWVLINPDILGYGFVFLSGLINDVVLSLPLGTSALCYLFVSCPGWPLAPQDREPTYGPVLLFFLLSLPLLFPFLLSLVLYSLPFLSPISFLSSLWF